jgi:hypothetical protein
MDQADRRRVRYVPNSPLKAGKFKIGEWFKLVGNTWIKFADQNVTPANTYRSVEVTLDQLNPGPPYKSGGAFLNVKSEILPVPIQGSGTFDSRDTFNNGDGAFRRRYVGGFSEPDFGGWDFTSTQLKDIGFLTGTSIVLPTDPYNSQVSTRLKPKLSQANLAQFLIELKDMPHMLSKTAGDFKALWLGLNPISNRRSLQPYMSSSEAAGTFLNHQFGWAPFLRDVEQLIDATLRSREAMLDLERRNSTWEHRSGVIKPEDVDNEITLATGFGNLVQPVASPLFQALLDTTKPWTIRNSILIRDSIKVWASGEWKFYRPEFDTLRQDFASDLMLIKRYITLYGARIDPYVLWKVMPWSWLVDWFATVGPFLDSLVASQLDGVVSRNLFLMHGRRRRIILRQEFNFWSGPRMVEFIRTIRVKQRKVAETPFGLGLKWENLSPMQWSILGAVGLTRKQPR